ncbi:MAG: DMT family transporter [Afipia sp.]|nr:DMT family transporter [Afipia sp.]OJW61964.1 MAG: peptide ABC transporter ATP-binding protein [Afipia sp. 64-13]
MNRDLEKWAARAAPAVFVVLWSSGFIGTKYALSGAEPLTFLTIRMVYVCVLLAVIVAVIRPAWPRGADIGHSIVAGLLVHGFYLAGVAIGIYHSVPAGLSALIPGLQPILTSTLANRWLGERVTLLQWAGLVLGLSGVLLVLHTRSMTGDIGWGWFATGVALVSITIGTLYQKRYCSRIDWRTGNLVQFTACGVMYALGALLFETREVIWSTEFILGVSWLVIALSIGSISVLYWLIRRAAATQVASLFYLVPATTALMAYVLFDERLEWLGIVGMAICAAGVFLVNKPAPKSDKTEVSPGS